jgi:hypothetical protein
MRHIRIGGRDGGRHEPVIHEAHTMSTLGAHYVDLMHLEAQGSSGYSA